MQAGVKYPLQLLNRVTTSDTGYNNNSMYFKPSQDIINICFNEDSCNKVAFQVDGGSLKKHSVSDKKISYSYTDYGGTSTVYFPKCTPEGINSQYGVNATKNIFTGGHYEKQAAGYYPGHGTMYSEVLVNALQAYIWCEDYKIPESLGNFQLKVIDDIGGQYSTSKSSDFAIDTSKFPAPGYSSYGSMHGTNVCYGFASDYTGSWSTNGATYQYNISTLKAKKWYFSIDRDITIKKIKVNV